MQDGHGSYPTPTNFTQRLVLDMERPHKLILGVSQLEAGDWKVSQGAKQSREAHAWMENMRRGPSVLVIIICLLCFLLALQLAVYNPMPSIPLNYTLAVVKVGRCLNDCSGNGECSSDGACQCHEGWLGGDCSVNQSGGGGKPAHRHGFATFMSSIFLMAVGAVAAFAYVSFQGIPRWLPLHNGAGFGGIGMYQELTEHEGI